MEDTITARRLMKAGLSKSFAHHVLAGTRNVGVPLALWLLDEHRIAVPPIAGKTRRELAVLRDMYRAEPPKSIRERIEAPEAKAA